jgi:hypothetical protein
MVTTLSRGMKIRRSDERELLEIEIRVLVLNGFLFLSHQFNLLIHHRISLRTTHNFLLHDSMLQIFFKTPTNHPALSPPPNLPPRRPPFHHPSFHRLLNIFSTTITTKRRFFPHHLDFPLPRSIFIAIDIGMCVFAFKCVAMTTFSQKQC